MQKMENKRVITTIFKLHHEIMIDVTEDDSLGTVGEEFKTNVDVALASANVLATKLDKKVG